MSRMALGTSPKKGWGAKSTARVARKRKTAVWGINFSCLLVSPLEQGRGAL